MTPKEVVSEFVTRFNAKDAEGLSALYAPDAVNHQMPKSPVTGREQIRQMFEHEFRNFEMRCVVENIIEEEATVVLEWSDPSGMRGCGIFQIENGQIKSQRGYWDGNFFAHSQTKA